MKICEIYSVPHEKSYRWKWRPLEKDAGAAKEQEREYQLYYDCLLAARENGYEPALRQPAARQRRSTDERL